MARRPEVDHRKLQGVPRVRWVQKSHDSTDAEDAIFLASHYRLIPDAWQADVVHSWMGRRRNRKWTHSRCGLAVPRQNGKNAAIEIRELFGLIELNEAILHTAHLVKTGRKAFRRLKSFFGEKVDDPNAKFPELNALVAEVRNTNGQEAIFLKDIWLVDGQQVRSVGRPNVEGARSIEFIARGGFIEFATRTGAGGRGETYDLLIIDEAQHLSEEDLEAIRPVISSGPLGNSQVIYTGTPPDPDKLTDKIGEAWVRIRSLSGGPEDLAWIEFGAPDGPLPDLNDLALLYACNPSLDVQHANGAYGLTMEMVVGERDEMSPAGVARERFGWWGNPEAKSQRGVIDMDQWRTLRVAGNELPSRGLIVVDVSPDLKWTTVALATDGPGGRPLGLVDRNVGTSWAPARIKQLVADLDSVLEVALTPSAKIFAADLTALKIEFKQLTTSDVGAGCTAFQRMVKDSEVAHVDQAELTTAVRQAITKFVGGETQQWDRRNEKVDISPLVAVSVAVQRWALMVAQPKKTGVPRRRSAAPTPPATQRQAPPAKTAPRPGRSRGNSGGFDPRRSGF